MWIARFRRHTVRLALLLLLLAAFAWRLHGLAWQSLWRDEVDAIYFALRELPTTLAMFVQAGQNGPLYFIALRPWLHLAGASEFALRFPSVVAGTLGVALLWPVARRLLHGYPPPQSPNGAGRPFHEHPITQSLSLSVPSLLALTLFALNPYQLWYSQEGKMYALITTLVLLATWCWLQGIAPGERRGRPWAWLGYLITVSIALYCHLLMILLYPLHLLWFVLAWPVSKMHWRGYALALAGLTLPYLPMVWWQWDLLMAADKRTGFAFVPLAEMARTLLLNYSRGFLPWYELRWLTPLFFLGAAGLILGIGTMAASHKSESPANPLALAPWRRLALIVSWLAIPVLTIYGLSLRQPIFTDRYIIWITPAAMLLVTLGVMALWREAGVMGRSLAVLTVLYVVGFWLYAGWQQKALPMKYDLRGAVSYVAERRDPATLLVLQIPHMEWAYRYYSGPPTAAVFATSDPRMGRWAGGLWTNNGSTDQQARAEVAAQMTQITAGVAELWLLRSEVQMWDGRQLMDEWLEQHGEVVEGADFHGAQVRKYRMVNRE
jgi:uncharacterized membrane protein